MNALRRFYRSNALAYVCAIAIYAAMALIIYYRIRIAL